MAVAGGVLLQDQVLPRAVPVGPWLSRRQCWAGSWARKNEMTSCWVAGTSKRNDRS